MTLPAKTPAHLNAAEKRSIGKGVFQKCRGCGTVLTVEQLAETWQVCPDCGHHHTLPGAEWRKLLLDDGALDLWDEHIQPADPLGFQDGTGYPDRVLRARKTSGASEAVEVGAGHIDGRRVAYGGFLFSFMGGSMGSVVGERITRLFERATASRSPVVLVHASGGARMQEGILSLMQMARTVSALARFREVRKPFLSVLVHPTTGGVAASTALLGDINIAEPNALIGFAGPRVIESTIHQKLPEGFQSSEFLLEHGMVDIVAPRSEMKSTVSRMLGHLDGERS